MSLLSRIFDRTIEERSRPSPTDDYWYGDIGQMTLAGKQINANTAMQIGAVFACVRVLAESISTLPCLMYERTENGRNRADNHPIAELLRYQPNSWQTAVEFWDMMIGHAALRGNSFAEIVPGPRGFADQLVPLHPDRVTVNYLKSGIPDFEYRQPNGTKRNIPFDMMFWLKGPFDGMSVITAARESFGLAMATEEHAARLFGQGVQISGVLEHPERLDDEVAERIAKSFSRAYAGVGNAHRPAVLEEGMKWQKIGLTAEDSQFIQSRKFQRSEIAMWFRIPPHMIGDLERATFSNIEHQGIEFVVHTLRPWLVRIEQAIRRDLILAPRRYFSKFLVDGLLRGDQKSRYEAYHWGIIDGHITRNEVRELENRNPKDGLDDPLIPANMMPVGSNPETVPQSSSDNGGRVRQLLGVSAERIVRRQVKAITKSASTMQGDELVSWMRRYMDHQIPFIAENLAIDQDSAKRLCDVSANEIAASDEIIELMGQWEENRASQIVQYVENLQCQ